MLEHKREQRSRDRKAARQETDSSPDSNPAGSLCSWPLADATQKGACVQPKTQVTLGTRMRRLEPRSLLSSSETQG